jgi:hypothetical protein
VLLLLAGALRRRMESVVKARLPGAHLLQMIRTAAVNVMYTGRIYYKQIIIIISSDHGATQQRRRFLR